MPVRRPSARGAVSMVLVTVSGWILGAGLTAVGVGTILVTEERAQSAADSAAHAAVGELATDSYHDEIARLVENGSAACWWVAAPRYGPEGATFDEHCGSALGVAKGVLRHTTGAQLLALTVVDGPQDNHANADEPARLEVSALVAVDRGLPVLGRTCDDIPQTRSTLCFAVAASSAQEG
jgi:putative Flp pilus-assembly TadE/G-like protein